ncbi:MAG TPA: hypothetical protein VEH84_11780 [Alphaproteobacteria bacterium]|nr:hypothetical protein [Alphaproteobacteria bacterium]
MRRLPKLLLAAILLVAAGAGALFALRRPAPPAAPPLPEGYEAQAACAKRDYLWNERILPSRHAELPPIPDIDVPGLILAGMASKMDLLADQAPPGWRKPIHARGSVAAVRFVAEPETPFTGLFRGAECGLIRLSLTGAPEKRGVAPGLALKLFVDGRPSANMSALFRLDGQGADHNYFANEFSNIVPESDRLGTRFVSWLFGRTSAHPTRLYLADFAQTDSAGRVEGAPVWPLRLFLVPGPDLAFESAPHDVRADFARIPAGTTLFTVMAHAPSEASDAAAEAALPALLDPAHRGRVRRIGRIETTSAFVASAYGDDHLFFRHQRYANR